ncbi:MAG: hypothetical protein JKY90_06425 [Gammaproteobacteria bacterium]|nr:hypothetical protein [Gammaproteobacteria bacterium]
MSKWVLLFAALMVCNISIAAKCKVGDEWYSYSHPKCSGDTKVAVSTRKSLDGSLQSFKSKTEFQEDSRVLCKKQWTKRGKLDSRMYQYCIRQQKEAYSDLVSLDRYADQQFYSSISFPHCTKKWTKQSVSDARMLAYCLNQEVEGEKDIAYIRKKYGSKQVDGIVIEALRKFGSMNMAAYKVKQYFE